MFSGGYGFVVDYLAEVLRFMCNSDFSDKYQEYFTLGPSISTRDWDGIHETFSGLIKVMYPTASHLVTVAAAQPRLRPDLLRHVEAVEPSPLV